MTESSENLSFLKSQLEKVDNNIQNLFSSKSDRENNQGSLFNFEEQNSDQTSISKTEWKKKELLEREREMLGFFVSEDPLDGYGAVLKSESSHSIIELLNTEEDELEDLNVVIAGLISNVQKRVSRRGNPWIQFDLQDVTGSTGVLLFNKLVDKYNSSIEDDSITLAALCIFSPTLL